MKHQKKQVSKIKVCKKKKRKEKNGIDELQALNIKEVGR